MKATIIKYKQLWFILFTWVIAGNVFQPLANVLVILSIFLFLVKDRPVELFIGFLFILLLSDHRVDFGPDPTQFAKDLKSIYLLVLTLSVWRNRDKFLMSNPIFKLLIPFFIIAFIGLIWAINIQIGLQKTISYTLLYAIIPIVFFNIYQSKGLDFIKAIAAYFFLIVLIGLIVRWVLPDVAQLLGQRFRGLFGNPNGLGLFIVQLFLFLTILRNYKLLVLSRREWLLFYFVIFLSLFLSGSRNGMITILLFLSLIRIFKFHFLFGLLVLIGFFYIYQFISFNPVDMIQSLGLENYFRIETIETGSGRYIAWDFAWQKIQDSFFLGGGFGQDEQIMRPNYQMLKRLGHSGGVHNSYLSLWMDTGLIGLIFYFFAVVILILRSSKNSALAMPFFFAIVFNITYESWLVGSLNPYTTMFLCSLTLLVMKDKFLSVKKNNV